MQAEGASLARQKFEVEVKLSHTHYDWSSYFMTAEVRGEGHGSLKAPISSGPDSPLKERREKGGKGWRARRGAGCSTLRSGCIAQVTAVIAVPSILFDHLPELVREIGYLKSVRKGRGIVAL